MARSILDIVTAHPELGEMNNSIPSLHYLAAAHGIGSWKQTGGGFVKHFGPRQEAELLSLLHAGGAAGHRYDPLRNV